MSELQALGDCLKAGAGARAMVQRQLDEALVGADRSRAEAELLAGVVELFAAVQTLWREDFQRGVGTLVGRGLSGVFGEPLELVVELGQHGNLPSARFRLRDDTDLETEIVDARGGGLVNVVALLLQVYVLLSARPPMRRLLLMDEALNNVHDTLYPALAGLLWRLAAEGGFQFVIVSQREALAEALEGLGAAAYDVSRVDGATRAVRRAGEAVAGAIPTSGNFLSQGA